MVIVSRNRIFCKTHHVFQSLQKAIDFAREKETVWVAPGIYYDRSIIMRKGIHVKEIMKGTRTWGL